MSFGTDSSITIGVETVEALQSYLANDRSAKIQTLQVKVARWEPPVAGWSGRLGRVRTLASHSVRLPATVPGEATVHIEVTQAQHWQELLGAALDILRPAKRLPSLLTPHVAYATALPVIASAHATWEIDAEGQAPSRRFDVSVGTATPFTVAQSGAGEQILVGEHAASPRWRRHCGPEQPSGHLEFIASGSGYQWQVVHARTNAVIAKGRIGESFDRDVLERLGQLNVITWAGTSTELPDAAYATALVQLSMTGVIVHTPQLDKSVEALLDEELVRLFCQEPLGLRVDQIEWEMRSIVQRRQSLRTHSAAFTTPHSAGLLTSERLPSVSAILVTRRPGQIEAAVTAMAGQSYPNLEIVVGLHGIELSAEQRSKLAEFGRPLRIVSVPVTASLGEALAVTTSVASGSIITKVDDDDFYGPEHLWDLVVARMFSHATVVGKGAEFVYLQPFDTTVRRFMGSEFYTDVVAGGTMLLSRGDLEEAGGWRPMPRSVDRGLLDRIIAAGGLVYRTHAFGFIYTRHAEGHTWDPGMDYFLRDPRRRWRGLPQHGEFGTR